MSTITEDTIEPFVRTAHQSGCPADQVYNFLKAGVILHPKQLLASAAARECDLENGPRAVGFGGARGGGKALSLSTYLPTFRGWKTMEDVEVGDHLLDDETNPCTVTRTTGIMWGHEVYEVEFGYGAATIKADAGHLWLTHTEDVVSRLMTWTTEQILQTLSRRHCVTRVDQHGFSHYWHITAVRPIPSEPVKCISVDSPTRTYLVGKEMIPTHNSHWMVAQIGADDCQRVNNLKCLILRKIAKAGKENFEDLRREVFHSLEHHYVAREGVLTFPNDSRMIIGHFKDENEIDNYLGLQYDVIGIEEATTLSSKKQKDIESCNRTSKRNFRPRMYSTTNPGGVSHMWYKQKFIYPWRAGNQTQTRFIMSLARDNPTINKEYVKDVLGQYTGWQYRAWAEGDWDIEAGQYYTNFHYETHVVPRVYEERDERNRVTRSVPFELPPSWDVWCSLDHGLTHYTVVYLIAQDGDGNLWFLDEHAERGWLPRQHAVSIKAMLARWEVPMSRLKSFPAGDDCFHKRAKAEEEEIGTIADDYKKEGIVLTRANVNRINGAKELYQRLGNPKPELTGDTVIIRPSIFFLTSCPRLIDCIPAMQRDPKRPEDTLKVDTDPDTGEGGDDPIDSARYGYMEKATSMRGTCTGSTFAGPRRDFSNYKPR